MIPTTKYVDIEPMSDDAYIDLLSNHLHETIRQHPDEIGLVLSYADLVDHQKK